MSTPVTLGAYAAGLVLSFVGGWAVGAAVPPVLDEPAPADVVPAEDHGGEHP